MMRDARSEAENHAADGDGEDGANQELTHDNLLELLGCSKSEEALLRASLCNASSPNPCGYGAKALCVGLDGFSGKDSVQA